MQKKTTSAPLRKAREALNKAHPDDVREITVTEFATGVLHIEATISSHQEEENRWVRFAEQMHEESLLRGKSEEVNRQVRRFRDHFSFQGGDIADRSLHDETEITLAERQIAEGNGIPQKEVNDYFDGKTEELRRLWKEGRQSGPGHFADIEEIKQEAQRQDHRQV